MFEDGDDFAKDDAKAVEWYQKSALQGYARAQLLLVLMFSKEGCTSKDGKIFFEWAQKAADQGDSQAQWVIGKMYSLGVGVPQDSEKAVEWCRKAEELWENEVQFTLGKMYAAGMEVPKDDLRAYVCLKRSIIASGPDSIQSDIYFEATDALEKLKLGMSSEQKAEAEKLLLEIHEHGTEHHESPLG
jgi:TPR repeat protein